MDCIINEIELDELALKTDGFSGSDIAILFNDAIFEPVRTSRMATHFRPVVEDGKKKWAPC